MLVLVACEFSGVVRRAFAAKGHEVYSCDLLPSEDGSPNHYREDCRETLTRKRWDLLIHHTPCTFATLAGARWLYLQETYKVPGKGGWVERKRHTKTRDPVRWRDMEDGAALFRAMHYSGVPRVCGENPIPHRYAQALMGKYSQIIQPWQFGHGEIKATCLWLKNLPLLTPTNIVSGRTPRVHHASPGPDRWKERSRTLEGIAAAMADQWNFEERA